MTENVSMTSARLPKVPKQPNSADLIRHRRYNLCVICEERQAKPTGSPVATKWWTCRKCEQAS